jgi:hypothetical protein
LAIFIVSLKNINKALREKKSKSKEKLYKKIPKEFYNLLLFFIKKKVDKLNLYKPRVNHKIYLKKNT